MIDCQNTRPPGTCGIEGDARRAARVRAVGTGPRTLVVLPGLALGNEAPSGLTARAYSYGFRALAKSHTVHVVRRPTMAGIIADEAKHDTSRLRVALATRQADHILAEMKAGNL